MDRYLLDIDNGWASTPKVRLSLLRFNGPPLLLRSEENYPPKRTTYNTLYLESASGKLQRDRPTLEGVASYQSDSQDDDGAHFTYTFDKYTELCGFSKAKLFMSCNELDDMDVYVIIRKLDSDGNALMSDNIPFLHQKPGVKIEDIPDENIYKYVGPSGRLRASKRLTAEEPGLSEEKRALKDPTELWYPHYESHTIPAGEVVELDIALWPGGIIFERGESLRFEVKGHNPILPDVPILPESMKRELFATMGDSKDLNVGRHNVHTGPNYRSSITLPLIH
jgi:predicted acyl esterase